MNDEERAGILRVLEPFEAAFIARKPADVPWDAFIGAASLRARLLQRNALLAETIVVDRLAPGSVVLQQPAPGAVPDDQEGGAE